jgi:hypothetical protein
MIGDDQLEFEFSEDETQIMKGPAGRCLPFLRSKTIWKRFSESKYRDLNALGSLALATWGTPFTSCWCDVYMQRAADLDRSAQGNVKHVSAPGREGGEKITDSLRRGRPLFSGGAGSRG